MKIKKAFKLRIYPNKSQQILIEKTLGCCRQVYNDFLAMCIEKHASDPTFKINKYDLIKMLPEYKETFPYLKSVDSVALQQSIINLQKHILTSLVIMPNFLNSKRKEMIMDI